MPRYTPTMNYRKQEFNMQKSEPAFMESKQSFDRDTFRITEKPSYVNVRFSPKQSQKKVQFKHEDEES